MLYVKNITPHEREALLIADKMDRHGDTALASAIRARIDSVGILDDLDLRALMASMDFAQEQIVECLRRVHASIAANVPAGN